MVTGHEGQVFIGGYFYWQRELPAIIAANVHWALLAAMGLWWLARTLWKRIGG